MTGGLTAVMIASYCATGLYSNATSNKSLCITVTACVADTMSHVTNIYTLIAAFYYSITRYICFVTAIIVNFHVVSFVCLQICEVFCYIMLQSAFYTVCIFFAQTGLLSRVDDLSGRDCYVVQRS